MSDLYQRPKYPPDHTPDMGGNVPLRWHEERSVTGFLRRAVETGWLVPVEPDLEAVAGLLAAAYMGVPVSAEQVVNAALREGDDE